MKGTIVFVYIVMSLWLMIAAVARIALQLAAGQDLDALPFVSGGIGLVGLILLLPAYEDWRSRSRD